jgi:NAD(P)-dependent dehydrogenase (short-subunit alcohol dehydrogenase family)
LGDGTIFWGGTARHAYELARRLGGTGITVNCVHPGPVKTEFTQKAGGFLSVINELIVASGLHFHHEYLNFKPAAVALT